MEFQIQLTKTELLWLKYVLAVDIEKNPHLNLKTRELLEKIEEQTEQTI